MYCTNENERRYEAACDNQKIILLCQLDRVFTDSGYEARNEVSRGEKLTMDTYGLM